MQLHWHTEPFLLITLLGVGWLYALAIGPLRNRIVTGKNFPIRQCILFYSGLVVTYLAVGSPLDQLGEQFLFSAHMLQHMLLIYTSTTLFIYGTPAWLIDWLLKPKPLRKIMSALTHPACGGLLFTFVYTVWPCLPSTRRHSKINASIYWNTGRCSRSDSSCSGLI